MTALDIDYRPNLWGVAGHDQGESRFVASARVTEALQQVLRLCDLIVGTEEEFHIAGGTGDTLAALRHVRALTDAVLVVKRGPLGAVAIPGVVPRGLDDAISGPGFAVEVFNVLGAGDGFMAGLLAGRLQARIGPRRCASPTPVARWRSAAMAARRPIPAPRSWRSSWIAVLPVLICATTPLWSRCIGSQPIAKIARLTGFWTWRGSTEKRPRSLRNSNAYVSMLLCLKASIWVFASMTPAGAQLCARQPRQGYQCCGPWLTVWKPWANWPLPQTVYFQMESTAQLKELTQVFRSTRAQRLQLAIAVAEADLIADIAKAGIWPDQWLVEGEGDFLSEINRQNADLPTSPPRVYVAANGDSAPEHAGLWISACALFKEWANTDMTRERAERPVARHRHPKKGAMMQTIRLTAAQALVRYLLVQMTEEGDPFIAGVWAIFGHGNVAGLGEALEGARDALPTYRGHNEQTMAHAAIAYAKQSGRRRAMAVTSSIGPGATNMVTAAALAHVNRLPLLLLPGDVFAGRGPDPVLATGRGFWRRHDFGQRLLSPCQPLFRSDHPSRTTADNPAARLCGDDRSGRVWPGDAGVLSGRAGRSL